MSSIVYVPYGNGKRVSEDWDTVLSAADKDGVQFTVNSGHRTMAEQAALYNANMLNGRPRPGHALTAVPSASAPHIRLGKRSHALDVEPSDGGVQRLAAYLRSKGASVSFPVRGESWHIEIPERDLIKLAARLRDPLADYPVSERRWIREYDDLLRLKMSGKDTTKAMRRRSVLRRVMYDRASSITTAAQKTGWHKLHRLERHKSLKSRATQ
jgi:hypothetical protein